MAADLQRELDVITELAARAGDVIMEVYRRGFEVDHKAGAEPVTAADHASQEVILAGIHSAFPDDGVLAEEDSDVESWRSHQRAWLVDPMDGTKDFVARREGFSVMIGLLHRGRPVLGVVYQPTTGLTYRAAIGAGAEVIWADGRREALVPSGVSDPGKIRLVASASHRTDEIDRVKKQLGITDELNVGSVGLKVGLVGRGVRDLYFNPASRCRLWDTCAPEAILTEAGGRITDMDGAALSYEGEILTLPRGIVASNGACHDQVIEKIAPLFA